MEYRLHGMLKTLTANQPKQFKQHRDKNHKSSLASTKNGATFCAQFYKNATTSYVFIFSIIVTITKLSLQCLQAFHSLKNVLHKLKHFAFLRETSLAWLQKSRQVKLKNNCSSISVNYDYKNLLQYLLGELLFPNWRIIDSAAEWDGSAAAAAVNHRTCQNMLSHTANCTTRSLHSTCHILVNKQRSHTVTKGNRSDVINFVDAAVSPNLCAQISWNNLLQFWKHGVTIKHAIYITTYINFSFQMGTISLQENGGRSYITP